MRIALTILIGIHGMIHLFGFLKAFGLSEFNAIAQPVSKPLGILWLLAFILFAGSAILVNTHTNSWWILTAIAVLLSQFLIISFWTDARFGTIINLIILVFALFAYSSYSFKKKVNRETEQMFSKMTASNETIVSEQMIQGLPSPVRNWLVVSGMLGKQPIQNVFLQQDLDIQLKPEQKEWNKAKANQYFTTEPPAFNWSLNLKMNPVIQIVGRDKFEDGKGEMTIKLFSLLPVANVKDNAKVNEATLQRYLAEIVWFPSAALSPYIQWEAIDETSARSTMTFGKTKGFGVFYFDKNGYFQKFVAMRYKDTDEGAGRIPWTVTAIKTEQKNGIYIPVELEADWTLESEDWTWLKLKISHIEYNRAE